MSMIRLLLFALALLLLRVPAAAQPPCGVAESITYPVDTTIFEMVQRFGAPSSRHQGRYHTGEDWFAGRAPDYGIGAIVGAAANGRVTYASPVGWGRDGGVVIIEHTFADGSIAYTQYGHLFETDSARFPPNGGCIRAGDVIGALGDVRPAPHLHFEVRVRMPDTPGPGYSWGDPVAQGWRDPGPFIGNRAVWDDPAFRWRAELTDPAGRGAAPLPLDDESLLFLDAGRLGRLTPDGRLLWRITPERSPVAISAYEGAPLLIYADGVMQHVGLDGSLGERWDTGIAPAGPPLTAGALWLLPVADGGVVAFGPDLRAPLWSVDGVGTPDAAQAAGQIIGVTTAEDRLLTLTRDGRVLHRAQLRGVGALAVDQDGALLAYTSGGLWSILADGVWRSAADDPPPSDEARALLRAADGTLYLFDGGALHAYDRAGTPRWRAAVPGVGGRAMLTQHGDRLLLISSGGTIAALDPATGALCRQIALAGAAGGRAWSRLGADGVLRIALDNQIIALNWAQFSATCP